VFARYLIAKYPAYTVRPSAPLLLPVAWEFDSYYPPVLPFLTCSGCLASYSPAAFYCPECKTSCVFGFDETLIVTQLGLIFSKVTRYMHRASGFSVLEPLTRGPSSVRDQGKYLDLPGSQQLVAVDVLARSLLLISL